MMMGGDWRALPDPWLLWPNPVVLLVSSISLQWSSLSARRGETRGIRRGLLAAGISAFLFMVGHLMAVNQLVDWAYSVASTTVNPFFLLLTSLQVREIPAS